MKALVLTLALAAAATVHAQEHAHPPHHAEPAYPAPESASADEHAHHGEHSADHAAMGHQDHGEEAAVDSGPVDHAAMGHGTEGASTELPREPIPAITDADRAAAFPELDAHDHAAHGEGIHSFLQLDRLEAWDADEGTGLGWEALGWIGGDIDRMWLRSEGERLEDETESAYVELLYGRAVSPWWDLVAGVRQDFGPGPSQTMLGVGFIGLAPYMFEIEATAYFGEGGQSAAVVEAEYELLLTNRLILQPLVEASFYGSDDPRRGIGSGLSTMEAGARLRYEFTRRFAPYLGITYERAFGATADLRGAEGEERAETQVVLGLRTWF